MCFFQLDAPRSLALSHYCNNGLAHPLEANQNILLCAVPTGPFHSSDALVGLCPKWSHVF